jgi:hypothetical protein
MAGSSSPSGFFANALRNRVAMVPAAAGLATFGNNTDGNAQAALNSYVRASSVNGAGPNADPSDAPWGGFLNFALGKSGAKLVQKTAVKSGGINRFKR